MLARSTSRAADLTSAGENLRYLPGVPFPASLTVHSDSAEALRDAELIIVAVPSVAVRSTMNGYARVIASDTVVVSATKGLEIATGKRMSEVIADSLRAFTHGSLAVTLDRVCALSGPNLAVEIGAGLPALATVASANISTAERVQRLMSSERFRLYASSDIVGVELGGTLKNIIAIGAGFIDVSGLGANIKAAYVTRGLHEITRLGVAMGANKATFTGLSGTGDMLATCYSALSRNYRLGCKIASGVSLDDALDQIGQTAEGVPTTRAAVRLAHELAVEMPLTEASYRVMFEGVSPDDSIRGLMARELQHEEAL